MVLATEWCLLKNKLSSPFLRYLTLGTSISFIVIILSILSLQIVKQVTQEDSIQKFTRPPEIISFFIKNTPKDKRIQLINDLNASHRANYPFKVLLTNSIGDILAPKENVVKKIDIDTFLPLFEFHNKKINHQRNHKKSNMFSLHNLLTPLRPTRHRPPPRHLNEAPNFKFKLIDSNNFLVFQRKNLNIQNNTKKRFFFSLLALICALTLGIGLTITFMFLSFKRKTLVIDNIIEKLKSGDLKARIPVGRIDEYSQTAYRFNDMAEEIESLVNSLRITENSRKNLMRELAHDLRTPISSLKNCIEMVKEKSNQLSEDKRNQLLSISLKETEYFSLLVDDLLFLGQVNEPRYQKDSHEIFIDDLIQIEVQNLKDRYSNINFIFNGKLNQTPFKGDRKLITRLVRNGLENACSFAKNKVTISTEIIPNKKFRINIEDNGPGFSAGSLVDFGKRKYSREVATRESNRISIGLGSVIMKSIVSSYRGELNASNVLEDNHVKGALLTITLPSV